MFVCYQYAHISFKIRMFKKIDFVFSLGEMKYKGLSSTFVCFLLRNWVLRFNI